MSDRKYISHLVDVYVSSEKPLYNLLMDACTRARTNRPVMTALLASKTYQFIRQYHPDLVFTHFDVLEAIIPLIRSELDGRPESEPFDRVL